jgi:CBS domain-containing protein
MKMPELEKSFNLENYVNNSLVIANPDTPVTELYQMMQKHRVRHLPIVEEGKAVGIVSDRDVKFVAYSNGVVGMSAKQIMTEDPYTVTDKDSLQSVVGTMNEKKINSALIENSAGKIVGIFTTSDALKLLADHVF